MPPRSSSPFAVASTGAGSSRSFVSAPRLSRSLRDAEAGESGGYGQVTILLCSEHRPGFAALLTGAKSKKFDVVVTMSLDRIGCESIKTAASLLDIVDAGVRMFYYNDGSEPTLDTPISKAMLSLQGFGAEDYKYQIKQKTREALRNKAKKGHGAGNKAYGYDHVRVGSDGKRAINEREAVVVRRIFDLCAQGLGMLKIARILEKEGMQSPRGMG